MVAVVEMGMLGLRRGLGHYSGFFFAPAMMSRAGAQMGSCGLGVLPVLFFPVWLPWWVHGEQGAGSGACISVSLVPGKELGYTCETLKIPR